MTHAERLHAVAKWFRRRVDHGRGFAEPETSGREARAAYDALAADACLAGAAALEAQAEEVGRLRLMAVRWLAEAEGVEAMGYSQQAERIRERARELDAALSPAGKEQNRG